MDRHFPDASAVGFEPLIDGMSLPDPRDRHVLAARTDITCHFQKTHRSRPAEIEQALITLADPDPRGPDIKASEAFLDPLFKRFYDSVIAPDQSAAPRGLERGRDHKARAFHVVLCGVPVYLAQCISWDRQVYPFFARVQLAHVDIDQHPETALVLAGLLKRQHGLNGRGLGNVHLLTVYVQFNRFLDPGRQIVPFVGGRKALWEVGDGDTVSVLIVANVHVNGIEHSSPPVLLRRPVPVGLPVKVVSTDEYPKT